MKYLDYTHNPVSFRSLTGMRPEDFIHGLNRILSDTCLIPAQPKKELAALGRSKQEKPELFHDGTERDILRPVGDIQKYLFNFNCCIYEKY